MRVPDLATHKTETQHSPWASLTVQRIAGYFIARASKDHSEQARAEIKSQLERFYRGGDMSASEQADFNRRMWSSLGYRAPMLTERQLAAITDRQQGDRANWRVLMSPYMNLHGRARLVERVAENYGLPEHVPDAGTLLLPRDKSITRRLLDSPSRVLTEGNRNSQTIYMNYHGALVPRARYLAEQSVSGPVAKAEDGRLWSVYLLNPNPERPHETTLAARALLESSNPLPPETVLAWKLMEQINFLPGTPPVDCDTELSNELIVSSDVAGDYPHVDSVTGIRRNGADQLEVAAWGDSPTPNIFVRDAIPAWN